jgi:hypothetical protein
LTGTVEWRVRNCVLSAERRFPEAILSGEDLAGRFFLQQTINKY